MMKVTWIHPDGRMVDVYPDAKGTQRILAKAGFGPQEADVEAEPVDESETLELPAAAGKALAEAGYVTAADLRAASDDELLAVKGVGSKTVELIRNLTKGEFD